MTPGIFASPSVRDAWHYLRPKAIYLVSLFWILGLVGYFTLPVVIPMLFSDRYIAAVEHGKWLWLNLALSGPASYLATAVRAQRKTSFLYATSIGYPCLLFASFWVLAHRGVEGMVLAKVLANWVLAAVYVVWFVWYVTRDPVGTVPVSVSQEKT